MKSSEHKYSDYESYRGTIIMPKLVDIEPWLKIGVATSDSTSRYVINHNHEDEAHQSFQPSHIWLVPDIDSIDQKTPYNFTNIETWL